MGINCSPICVFNFTSDPLLRPQSTARSEGQTDTDAVRGRVNLLDIFKDDHRPKMTVVFHAILAPHFKFNQKNGDQVFMRFGGGAFYNFNVNILEMKPVR